MLDSVSSGNSPASSISPRSDAYGRNATTNFFLLPGWLNSGADHWQSRWETLHGHRRVEQDDWLWPRRGDWMARLEETLLGTDGQAVLVAHSLGCQLIAAWAAHSAHVGRVKAALLVAPPDTERADMPPNLFSWRPIVRARLPFAAHVVCSDDDPFCTAARAAGMASDWGCALSTVTAKGHLNADSGLGDWPEGHSLLQSLDSAPP